MADFGRHAASVVLDANLHALPGAPGAGRERWLAPGTVTTFFGLASFFNRNPASVPDQVKNDPAHILRVDVEQGVVAGWPSAASALPHGEHVMHDLIGAVAVLAKPLEIVREAASGLISNRSGIFIVPAVRCAQFF